MFAESRNVVEHIAYTHVHGRCIRSRFLSEGLPRKSYPIWGSSRETGELVVISRVPQRADAPCLSARTFALSRLHFHVEDSLLAPNIKEKIAALYRGSKLPIQPGRSKLYDSSRVQVVNLTPSKRIGTFGMKLFSMVSTPKHAAD